MSLFRSHSTADFKWVTRIAIKSSGDRISLAINFYNEILLLALGNSDYPRKLRLSIILYSKLRFTTKKKRSEVLRISGSVFLPHLGSTVVLLLSNPPGEPS